MTPDAGAGVVIGGGGHAAGVIDALLSLGQPAAAVLDADRAQWGRKVLGIPVLGGDELLIAPPPEWRWFVLGLGMVVPQPLRRTLFLRARDAGLRPLTVVHPRATVAASARLGAGCVVLAGAVVCARAEIGENAIVNTGAIVEHDCVIGDHVHVATGACLCGGVEVGEGSMIGARAVVRQGETIGRNVLVGCGAVVVSPLPDGVAAWGAPAAVTRPSTDEPSTSTGGPP